MSANTIAKEIFLSAIEIDRQDQRDAFVTGACRGDEALYKEVVALLEAHFEKDSWLDPRIHREAVLPTESMEPLDTLKSISVGTHIGNYKLLEQIGAGGMGIVFMAEQLKPIRRKVALKVIKPGMDTSQVVARFEAERQALALMDHPNIAHVLDAGATDSGRPYFVMELVRGIPITEYCDKNRLNTRERLKLFTTVCQAVQHAHNKGIIHRDIKPSNVLVTLHDGKPVPKIIDFGVAKATNQQLTERTLFTSFAQFVGTPLYMSPEQAELSGLDVDTRSDVYSLGVLLYELLTGTTPFDRIRLHQAALDEIRRIIRDEEPPRPSTRVSSLGDESKSCSMQRSTDPVKLKQLLQRELDWIVMKTLEKDRTRRYETVNQLAAEIQRYLDGQPVEACPPSTLYQLSKFASRHRTAALFASSLFAIILGSAVLAWALYTQARHARDVALMAQAEAHRERDRALDAENRVSIHLGKATQEKERADNHAHELKQRLYDFNIIKAGAAHRERDPKMVSQFLAECLPEQRGWEWAYLNHQISHTRSIALPGKINWDYSITPDMSRIITVDTDGVIRCLKLSDESIDWSQVSERLAISGTCISTNGRQFLVTGSRKSVASADSKQAEEGVIEAYNVVDGKLLWTLRVNRTSFLPAYFRDSSQFLVTVGDSTTSSEVQLRSAIDGKLIWSTPALTIASAIMNKAGTSIYVSESASAQLQGASVLRCLDANDRSERWRLSRPEASAIILSPDESEIVATGSHLGLVIYDATTGQHKETIPSPLNEPGLFVLGSATGNQVVTVAISGQLVVWDWPSKRHLEASRAPASGIDVRLTADGSQLAFLNTNTLRMRSTRKPLGSLTLVGHKSGYKGSRFMDDNRLCSVGTESAWRVWETATGQEITAAPLPGAGLELEIGPNGAWAAAATMKGTQVRDFVSGKTLQYWPQDNACWFVKRNQAGNLLATAGEQGVVRVYQSKDENAAGQWTTKIDAPIREFKANNSIHGLAVSSDGKTVYTLDSPGCELLAWDVKSGERELMREAQPGTMGRTVELSPDGRYLAIDVGGAVEVWSLLDKAQVKVLRDIGSRVFSLTFDHTSSRLLAGTQDGNILLWSLTSYERLLTFKAHSSSVVCLAMSPDNSTLVSTSLGGELKLWETKQLSSDVERKRELVQRATLETNRLTLQYRTPNAAMQQLLSHEKIPQELLPTVMNLLQTRMNAPVNLNAYAANSAEENQPAAPSSKTNSKAKAQPAITSTASKPTASADLDMTASNIKAQIDEALVKNLPGVLEPKAETPDMDVSGIWNTLCRSLVQKSRFNLEPAELIALLQRLKDNGEAPHYLLYLKGIAHLQVSEWAQAEVEISSAIALVPTKSPLWFTYAFRLAFLQAYVGKWNEYQKLCDNTLVDFQNHESSVVLERLSKMCLFSNKGEFDVTRVADIADRAFLATDFITPKIYVRLTRGIAELRRGRYLPALDDFQYVIQTGLPGQKDGHDVIVSLAKLYSAIASHHLGRTQEAQQLLSEARIVIKSFPTTSGWWPDWMMACIVQKEAEELIEQSSTNSRPANSQ